MRTKISLFSLVTILFVASLTNAASSSEELSDLRIANAQRLNEINTLKKQLASNQQGDLRCPGDCSISIQFGNSAKFLYSADETGKFVTVEVKNKEEFEKRLDEVLQKTLEEASVLYR